MTPTETQVKALAQQSGGMLFLRARTPLHPGAGASVGAVDLPVQREKHTAWPMIQSSAIKGVLRDHYRLHLMENGTPSRREADEDDGLKALFGPAKSDDNNDQYAGAVGFTDARILAFPLRSARGVFAWVTCPGVVTRLIEDIQLCGAAAPFDSPIITDDSTIILGELAKSTLWITSRAQSHGLVLEDMLFDREDDSQRDHAEKLANWLACNVLDINGATPAQFVDPRQRLVILPDGAFTHAVKYCTEIVTRIALDYDKKKVKRGALFSQELLPSETLLYAVSLAEKPRGGGIATAAAAMASLQEVFERKTIQLGGDETTGKGWCDTRLKSASNLGMAEGEA